MGQKPRMAVKAGSGKNTYGRLIRVKDSMEMGIIKFIKYPDQFIENSGNGLKLRKKWGNYEKAV